VLTVVLSVNTVKADHYDDGKADGNYLAEYLWSGNCADIWNFDSVCDELIEVDYTVNTGDNWNVKEYKAGGENAVNDVLGKYQLECFGNPDECTELGSAAAYRIARAFCNEPVDKGMPDYEANCHAAAITICGGNVGYNIDDVCPDKPLTTSELVSMQDLCTETVDELILRRFLRHR
jgi:hypothetical protein